MIRKATLWLITACLPFLALSKVGGQTLRDDINPALLYWQAFAVLPDLTPDDQKYLFETDWRTRPMDERVGELVLRFDQTFKLLRQAGASKVPCDWGIDFGPGPEVALPYLGKAKRSAQAAVLRARWFVRKGEQGAAREDLIAAFVLGRNVARDGVLISCLVQIAMECIVTGFVVQQWPELQSETIQGVIAGIDSAPPRVTIAMCMRAERVAFYEWLLRK